MKLSWGYRIAMLYIGFAIFIVYFVTRSMQEKIDLVVPDYYEQELKYQDHLESSNRNNNLSSPLSILQEEKNIIIKYPELLKGHQITGDILVFCPANNANDKSFPVKSDTNLEQKIPTSGFAEGMYRVKVSFEASGEKYFAEKQIVLQ